MKIIEILQRSDIETMYHDRDPDMGVFTVDDYQTVYMNLINAWNKLEESFSDEQMDLYDKCYFPVKQIHEEIIRKMEFERGFKMAMRIMCESLG